MKTIEFIPQEKNKMQLVKKYYNFLYLVLVTLSINLSFSQAVVNNIPGNYTYTIPSGVTTVTVQVWGSGGSGGGSSTNNNSGSGAGGGAYSTKTISVSAGDVITYSVGAGATVGAAGANGNNGNPSTLIHLPSATNIISNGGNRGNANSNTGGTGGTSIGGSTNTPGGNGNPGALATGGNGGNGANTTATGGTGVANGNGNPGIIPGGGGGGGERGGANQTGGAGANGQVIIILPPTITNLLTDGSVCAGSAITINGTNLAGVIAANVKIGGTPVTSITSNSATQIVAVVGSGTTGQVSVTTTVGTATSIGSLTVLPIPSNATLVSPNGATAICNGNSITLNATSAGNTIYWYTVATGGTSIGTSASGANFVVTPTVNTTYYAEVRNSNGCISSTRIATGLITVTTLAIPVVEFTQNANDSTYLLNSMCGTISGGGQNDLDIFSGNPGAGSTYQWQVSYDNGTTWVNGPGPTATTAQYVLDPAYTIYETTSGIYKFRITVSKNGCSATSNPITLTTVITSNLTPGAITGNQYYCALSANPTILTQTLAPTGGNGTFTYQWQSSTDNVNFTSIAGATAATYDPLTITQTTYYRRVVITGGCSAISNTVYVIVGAPTITPSASASVCVSLLQQNAILNYSATTGLPNTYSITWNSLPANTFVPVTNAALTANSISISVPAGTLVGTYTGSISVRNAGGCVGPATPFSIIVNPLATTPTITAGSSTSFCVGGNVVLTSSVGSSYLWSTGETTQSITVSTAGSFTVTVTNANGCSSLASLPTTTTTYYAQLAPDVETVTMPSCTTPTGSVHFHDLPSGNWTLNQIGTVNATITGSGTFTTVYGLLPGTYNFSVTNSTVCISPLSNTVVFNPITTTTWNGTNWSNGLPDATKNIVFNGSYSSTTNLIGCTCTILSGDIVINSTNSLTITNEVTVASGTLTFENNASLIQINNNAINTGAIVYKRNSFIRQLDYVYWGSPVSGFNINSLSTVTTPGPKYKWNPTVSNFNGGQGNWQDASGNTMIKGKGYIVRGPNSFTSTPSTFTASFTGIPNNGIIPIQVERGSIYGSAFFGTNGSEINNLSDNWNLLGNPYPSSIRASQFLLDNQATLQGNVRLWTHGTTPSNIASPFYATFTYNYNPNDYFTYNFTGSSCCPAADADLYIAAGQGFFVQMNEGPAATATVSFNNNLRSDTFDNSNFYKSSANNNSTLDLNIERNRIWLDIVGANNQSERTLVGYVAGATQENDNFFDASYSVSNTLAIYSLIGSDKINIQGRALPFDETDTVNLGINAPSIGTFSIAIAAVDGLFDNQNIYLEDTFLNVIHDLKQAPYTFSTATGMFNDRFKLRYTNSTLANSTFNSVKSVVFIKDSQLNIQSAENISQIEIYDISGKKVKVYSPKTSSKTFTADFSFENGAYIAKITLENGLSFSQKVIN